MNGTRNQDTSRMSVLATAHLSGGSISIMLKKKVPSMMRAVYGLKSGRPLNSDLADTISLNRRSMQA